MVHSYEELSKSALAGDFKCADGSSLGEMYKVRREKGEGENLDLI